MDGFSPFLSLKYPLLTPPLRGSFLPDGNSAPSQSEPCGTFFARAGLIVNKVSP